ncbi:MAG: hypothetical protein DHS20C08_08100 [Rhodomicrobium sp.]|nr:MAG: hypothetical protein DHS20C08_08100 [Rhodomicrobium sp.]
MHSPLKIVTTALAILSFIYASSITISQAHAACTDKISGKEIAAILLARAASRHCMGFPLSTKQLDSKLEEMKCNPRAKRAIEDIGLRFTQQFETIFKRPGNEAMCTQASSYKLSSK